MEPNSNSIGKFAKSIGLEKDSIVFMQQKHSGNVALVENGDELNFPNTDALITAIKLLPLAVLTADCLPILFYDPIKEVVAVSHAGYAGLLNNIIGNTITKMNSDFGSLSEKMLVGIGPCIETKCYGVGEERIQLFQKIFPAYHSMFTRTGGKYYLNLRMIAQQCLMKEGILKHNIEIMDICTKCDPHFYSYRGGDIDKRFVSIIGMV